MSEHHRSRRPRRGPRPGWKPTGTRTTASSSGATSSSTPAGARRTGRSNGMAATCRSGWCRSSTRSSSASAPSASPRWASARWPPPRSWRTAPTCTKERFLRRILTGEDTWCQLFSEPGSGSDAAGAVTRAERRGNTWVINGQKVWTTSAHHADWGLLLARTDRDVPKHTGLSYFIIDMHQPGVHGAAAQADERPRLLQPGVPHRRRRSRRNSARRSRGQRLEGRDHDADARAARRRRPAPLGGAVRSARPHLRGGAGRDRDRAGALQVVSAARRAASI